MAENVAIISAAGYHGYWTALDGVERCPEATELVGDQDLCCLPSSIGGPLIADPGIDVLANVAVWGIDGDRHCSQPGVKEPGKGSFEQ